MFKLAVLRSPILMICGNSRDEEATKWLSLHDRQ